MEHLGVYLEHLGGFGHTVWPILGPREVLGSRCKFLGVLVGYQGDPGSARNPEFAEIGWLVCGLGSLNSLPLLTNTQ